MKKENKKKTKRHFVYPHLPQVKKISFCFCLPFAKSPGPHRGRQQNQPLPWPVTQSEPKMRRPIFHRGKNLGCSLLGRGSPKRFLTIERQFSLVDFWKKFTDLRSSKWLVISHFKGFLTVGYPFLTPEIPLHPASPPCSSSKASQSSSSDAIRIL